MCGCIRLPTPLRPFKANCPVCSMDGWPITGWFLRRGCHLILVELTDAHDLAVVVFGSVLTPVVRRVPLRIAVARSRAVARPGPIPATAPISPVAFPVPRSAAISSTSVPPAVSITAIPITVAIARPRAFPGPRSIAPLLTLLAGLAVVILISLICRRTGLLGRNHRRYCHRRRLHDALQAQGLLPRSFNYLLHLGARAQQQLDFHLLDFPTIVHHCLTGIFVGAAIAKHVCKGFLDVVNHSINVLQI
ncbi:hypothetical protein PUN28_016633 [Cardiocondyla obscurior]|uniref:Uncharacterized protein n=1 Tax=Cardiocondyla obscurior TaxID=286306 RepID=A0AAW2ERT6_9HYME